MGKAHCPSLGGKHDNEYVNVCRLLLLSYIDAKCMFPQKVIYKKSVEQLSELSPRFSSGGRGRRVVSPPGMA
jgi:hypothetical protein